MACVQCGHPKARVREADNKKRLFCDEECQRDFYLVGGKLPGQCEVDGCEEWRITHEDEPHFFMCDKHRWMRHQYLGRLRNYWERLAANNPLPGPVESNFFYDHGKRAWVDLGAPAMRQQQQQRAAEEEEEEEREVARPPPVKRERDERAPSQEGVEVEPVRPAKRGGNSEEEEAMRQLRALLERARAACIPLANETAIGDEIRGVLEKTGVAVVRVSAEAATRIQQEVGSLVAQTFPDLSEETRGALQEGNFQPASAEWKKRGVGGTGMALRSHMMPNRLAMLATARPNFTDPVLNTVHLENPMLAFAPLRVWEVLADTNTNVHPANWFQAERMLCSEDGIKFSTNVEYGPTRIHYDGQPDRVQVVFSNDSGPVRLFAVPGSGTPEAQRLIASILGIRMLGGFSTHTQALDAHPRLRDLMHEFGVSVSGAGLLAFRTRVWHFEALSADGLARSVVPFDWARAKQRTKQSSVFRVYCGVVAFSNDARDTLIRHAYLRERGWPMEAFAHENRASKVFVAEKSTQDQTRPTYGNLQAKWLRVQAHSTLEEMRVFLRERVPEARLRLHGLRPADLK